MFSIIFTASIVIPLKAQDAIIDYPPQAIINASYRGDEETVRELLRLGVDKNVRDTYGDTALHVAMYQKNLM